MYSYAFSTVAHDKLRIRYILLDFTGVLLENNHFQTTEEEVAKGLMKYFRNAADRCGGRSFSKD